MDPGISERGATVLDRRGELIRGPLRVVGHHPLFARTQVRLGAQSRLGLPRELTHAYSGPHVIACPCCLKLNLVEFLDARHSFHGTPAALPYSHGLRARNGGCGARSATSVGRAPRRPKSLGAVHAVPRHAAGSRWAASTPGAAWPPGRTASAASWPKPPQATVREHRALRTHRTPGLPGVPNGPRRQEKTPAARP